MQAQNVANWNLESAIIKVRGLSDESQAVIASIINKLAGAEGVSGLANHHSISAFPGLVDRTLIASLLPEHGLHILALATTSLYHGLRLSHW